MTSNSDLILTFKCLCQKLVKMMRRSSDVTIHTWLSKPRQNKNLPNAKYIRFRAFLTLQLTATHVHFNFNFFLFVLIFQSWNETLRKLKNLLASRGRSNVYGRNVNSKSLATFRTWRNFVEANCWSESGLIKSHKRLTSRGS